MIFKKTTNTCRDLGLPLVGPYTINLSTLSGEYHQMIVSLFSKTQHHTGYPIVKGIIKPQDGEFLPIVHFAVLINTVDQKASKIKIHLLNILLFLSF